jgi:hypothetical protein
VGKRAYLVLAAGTLAAVACNALTGVADLSVGCPDCSEEASTSTDGATGSNVDSIAPDASVEPDGAGPCRPGESLCGATCVAKNVDSANCGVCGRACATGTACAGGACIPACDGGVLCAGRCTNPRADLQNCGDCGRACAAKQTCGNGTCVVDLTVTATRAPGSTSLVVSTPAGISCPGTCQASFLPSANVTLEATPTTTPPESLVEWTGACSGRDPTCTVMLDTPKSVGASFVALSSYAISTTALYSVNPSSGTIALVGNFAAQVTPAGGIGIDRRGNGYVMRQIGGKSELFAVNLANAATGALIGAGAAPYCYGLAFAPDPADPTKDILYCAAPTNLERVDVLTGIRTTIGPYGGGVTVAGDLSFMPGYGLFATSGAQTNVLVRLDQVTGTATMVGTIPQPQVAGLGRAGPSFLLGFSASSVLSISPTTGASTVVNAVMPITCHAAASGP